MKSNRASLFHSARWQTASVPDRNASPAARPWGRITPRNGSPSGSRALPSTGPRRRSAGEISLRIALEDSIKAQQSAGYARWAKLHNLKQAANSLNFITEHQIDSYEDLESRLAEISAANDAAAPALKDAERRLGDMALLIKNLSAYKQLRPVALELRNAKDKAAFRRQHESQLILYEAAAKALKEAGITKLPNLYALKTEYKKLDIERERLSAQYSEAKQKLKEYGIVKQNVDSILRTAPGKEHTQER